MVSLLWADVKYHVPTIQNFLGEVFYQETILSSGVFRRETASGFYPWGNVEGPRERVADGIVWWGGMETRFQ